MNFMLNGFWNAEDTDEADLHSNVLDPYFHFVLKQTN